MKNLSFRGISLLLIITFIAGQIQPAYALSGWLANDGSPMRDTKNAIAKRIEPGAIGNGKPLIDLVSGNLPEKVYSDMTSEKIRSATQIAMEALITKRHSVPMAHADRVEKILENMISLLNKTSSQLHLFEPLTEGPEDYLLGFNYQDIIGLDKELVETLYEISPSRLAQYIFHECTPEKDLITREDHRSIYRELQASIFGQDEVTSLGRDLRAYILHHLSAEKLGECLIIQEGQDGFSPEKRSFEIAINREAPPGSKVRMTMGTMQIRLGVLISNNSMTESLSRLGFYKEGKNWQRRGLDDVKKMVINASAYPDDKSQDHLYRFRRKLYADFEDSPDNRVSIDVIKKHYKLRFSDLDILLVLKELGFERETDLWFRPERAPIIKTLSTKGYGKLLLSQNAPIRDIDSFMKLVDADFEVNPRVRISLGLFKIWYNTDISELNLIKALQALGFVKIDSDISSKLWARVSSGITSAPAKKEWPPMGGGLNAADLAKLARGSSVNDIMEYIRTTGLDSQIAAVLKILEDDKNYLKMKILLEQLESEPLSDTVLEDLRTFNSRLQEVLQNSQLTPWVDGEWMSLPELGNMIMINRESGEIKFMEGITSLMSIDFDLWIARHGKTEGNALKVLQGRSNVPGLNQLSALGRQQAAEAAESLFESLEDKIRTGDEIVVVTSTLLRATETAEIFVSIVKERTGISLDMVVEEDADEISFGVAGNRPYETPDEASRKKLEQYGIDLTPLAAHEKTVQHAYLEGNAFASFVDGESFIDVMIRQKKLLERLNQLYRGKTVVMIGHGTQLNALRVVLGDDLAHPHDYIDWRGIELGNSETKHVGELSAKERVNTELIKRKMVRDFHAHSNCSDGLFDPAELVKHAAQEGVSQFVLADHDTLEGIEEARKAAEQYGINFMPGIELSTKFHGKNVHILGYGFDPENARQDKAFMTPIEAVKQADHQWAWEMSARSQDAPLLVVTPDGIKHEISVTKDEIEEFPGTMPSTFHIALILSRKLAQISDELDLPARFVHYLFFRRLEQARATEAYAPEIVEQYAALLGKYGIEVPEKGLWRVERSADQLQDTENAVKGILRIGGIPVLAHPGEQKLTEENIAEIASMGIKGIEIYSYKHTPELIEKYTAIAKKYGLFITSGTDFHDPYHRANVKLGKNREEEVLAKGASLVGFHEMGAQVHFADEWMPIDALDGNVLLNVQTGQIKYAEGAEPVLTADFELWSLRHGASYGNEQYILQGDRNEPVNHLSETGQKQAVMGAEDLFEQLGEERIRSGNIVYVASELVRSQQTADAFVKLVKDRLGIDIEYSEEALDNEFCFGEWGNQDRKTFVEGEHKDRIEWHRKWKEEFSATARPPLGDNFLDVIARNKQMLEKFNEQYKGKTVVVFDHGTCITAKRVLLGDKSLVNKDGVINWQKANFANVELRNLTDPKGMEVDPEKAGQILDMLFEDTSTWTESDWTPVMMFERTMKMAGTKEVDRIAIRTLFEKMEVVNGDGEEYRLLAELLTSDLFTSVAETQKQRFESIQDLVKGRGVFTIVALRDLTNNIRTIEKDGRISGEELREFYNTALAAQMLQLPKWSALQADKYVLGGMYDLATISENVDRTSEIVKTCETLVLGALQTAFMVQSFISSKQDLMVDEKADKSLVTEVDRQVNDFLKQQFSSLGIPFIGEESEHDIESINGGTYITVDPIDGTSNFVRMFNGELDRPALDNVTLISLVRDGVPIIGICLNHYTGELYIAINDGKTKLQSVQHLYIQGLDYPGTLGKARVSALKSDKALIMGSSAKDPVNTKYSKEVPTAQIGGLGFRIISLCNRAITDGLVYHKKQDAGLWDLAAAQVFASLNGVTIRDGEGNPLDFTKAPYFPGHGAMALKGNGLGYVPGLEYIPEIEAIIFDMDGTLCNMEFLAPHYDEALVKLVKRAKPDMSSEEIIARRKELRSWTTVVKENGLSLEEYDAQLESIPLNELVNPDKELRAMLERLAENYRLAVLTNNVGGLTSRILEALGVSDLFEAVVSCDTANALKPAPDIFKFTCQTMGIEPGVAVSVGDKHEKDVTPAIKFGMGAILVAGPSDMIETLEIHFPGKGAIAVEGNPLPLSESSHEHRRDLAEYSKNIRIALKAPTMKSAQLPQSETIIDLLKTMYRIPEEVVTKINAGMVADVDKALFDLAKEMVDLIPRIAEVSSRVENTKQNELGPKALYYYGKVFAELDLELMRKFMVMFAEHAGNNTFTILNMVRISYARGFVATEGELDIENTQELERFMEEVEIMERFHGYAATEMTITNRKGLPRQEAEALLKAAELAVKKDVHNFGPILLHMQAKNFSKSLGNILSNNPDKTYAFAIDSDLGKDQQSQLMEIVTALDEMDKMFPNLKVIRRSGSTKKNNLASELKDLIDGKEIDAQNIFMVVKQDNLEAKRFEKLQGQAWITSIDDSMASANAEGSYLPIFEAATISILASINADAEAVKKVYDSIALDPNTHKEITLEAIKEMMQNRTVFIYPKIEKIPLDDLKLIYERVRTVYLAA